MTAPALPSPSPPHGASDVSPTRLRFDDYELRLDARQLLRAGQPVNLGARAFDLLVALAQRHGRVVSKRELMSLVWPTTVVEEANLRVGMSGLRKELGPDLIATIPGRGYQFTMDVRTDVQELPQRHDGAMPRSEPPSAAAPVPVPSQRLIGREALLDQIRATLRDNRLLTLTGPSGTGKTSLAKELRLAGTAADTATPLESVHWVDLTASSDGDLLPVTIAQACGVRLPEPCGVRALAAAMRSVQALLILDNAEHLVDAAAAVVHELLEGCPQLRLLVTSQVRLKLDAETVLQVPPLDVARPGTAFSLAQAWPAQALFLRHCQRAGRPLNVDQRTLDLVGDICARLDGVPLAIEYAAAAVPLLGVQGVAAALEERRLAMSSGRRDAPQRHRTLRTALAWSVSLLGPYEQLVFRRLGVFAGSFPMALLDPITNLEGEDPWRLMEAISELIDRSLVVADDDNTPPRYRLLESVRAFAIEQLNERDEMTGLRERHAHAVERLFTATRRSAMAGDRFMDEAVSLLQVELGNARAALLWALERDAKLALGLVAGMAFVLRRSGGISEAGQCFAKTEKAAALHPSLAVHSGWAREALVHWTYTDPARAFHWAAIAEAAVREAADMTELIELLALKVNLIDTVKGDDTVLTAALDEIQAMDPSALPGRLFVLCATCILPAASRLGRDLVVHWVERCVQTCPPGDLHGKMSLASRLMSLHLMNGRAAEAIRLGEPLYAELREGQYQHALHWLPINLAQAYLSCNNPARAVAVAQESLASSHKDGLLYGWGDVLAHMACLAGLPDCAAGIRGYSDHIYATTGSAIGIVETQFRRAAQAAATEAMGDKAYRAACEAGADWDAATMYDAAMRAVNAFAAATSDPAAAAVPLAFAAMFRPCAT